MAGEFEGKMIADRYRVGLLLAGGLSEDLYHGTHVLMERPVILKLLPSRLVTDDGAVYRFLDKLRIESHLSHQNLLNLTDFGSGEDGSPYGIVESADIEPLNAVLSARGKLPYEEALNIATQAARGLDAATQTGIVHGGLSPANVLVPKSGDDVKVFDFGASVGIEERSPAYIAPEQITTLERSLPADVYALGAVLYEMVAGEPPFTGEEKGEVVKKALEEPPPPLSAFRSDLPAGIEPVILKALAKDPEQRYQTPSDFAAALETSTSPVPEEATASNNIWKTAFIVLAGISVLSAILIYATTSKKTDPTTALQADANGQPVQPINPATGAEEQSLTVPGLTAEQMMNTNTLPPQPGTLPGGDGYDPWARGGAPPPGAPAFPKGGQVITIDPNNPSQFMPPEGGVVLVPVPANTNTSAKPSPTPKTPAANANTATTAPPKSTEAKPSPTPTVKSPAQVKPTPAKSPQKPQKPEAER